MKEDAWILSQVDDVLIIKSGSAKIKSLKNKYGYENKVNDGVYRWDAKEKRKRLLDCYLAEITITKPESDIEPQSMTLGEQQNTVTTYLSMLPSLTKLKFITRYGDPMEISLNNSMDELLVTIRDNYYYLINPVLDKDNTCLKLLYEFISLTLNKVYRKYSTEIYNFLEGNPLDSFIDVILDIQAVTDNYQPTLTVNAYDKRSGLSTGLIGTPMLIYLKDNEDNNLINTATYDGTVQPITLDIAEDMTGKRELKVNFISENGVNEPATETTYIDLGMETTTTLTSDKQETNDDGEEHDDQDNTVQLRYGEQTTLTLQTVDKNNNILQTGKLKLYEVQHNNNTTLIEEYTLNGEPITYTYNPSNTGSKTFQAVYEDDTETYNTSTAQDMTINTIPADTITTLTLNDPLRYYTVKDDIPVTINIKNTVTGESVTSGGGIAIKQVYNEGTDLTTLLLVEPDLHDENGNYNVTVKYTYFHDPQELIAEYTSIGFHPKFNSSVSEPQRVKTRSNIPVFGHVDRRQGQQQCKVDVSVSTDAEHEGTLSASQTIDGNTTEFEVTEFEQYFRINLTTSQAFSINDGHPLDIVYVDKYGDTYTYTVDVFEPA